MSENQRKWNKIQKEKYQFFVRDIDTLSILKHSTQYPGFSWQKWNKINTKVRIQQRTYTGYTQKNGAVSKVNNKFIPHLTRAQRTPSAAATVQVSHAPLAVRFCGAAGPVSKMESQQEKAFCVLRFEVSRSVITVQREFRARFRKDAPCVVRLF